MNLQVIKEDLTLIKNIPEDLIGNKVLDLGVFLDSLLSLQGESSAKRLEVLLPMIKEAAWSLSFPEIKKAFIMYVSGKLPLEPRDNYLTVILFNKVIQAYKQQKPVVKLALPEPKVNESDKLKILNEGVKRCISEVKESGVLQVGNSHIYDHLQETNVLVNSKNQKQDAMLQAKINIKRNKNPLTGFQKAKIKEGEVIAEAKRILLEKYIKKQLSNGKQT